MIYMTNNKSLNLSTTTGLIVQHIAKLLIDNQIVIGDIHLETAILIEELGSALQLDDDVSSYTFGALKSNGFCAPKYSRTYLSTLVYFLLKDAGQSTFEECWSQTEQEIEDKYRHEAPSAQCLYKLHHHYDIGDQSVYFTFPQQHVSAVDLAVYLQFKAEALFDDSICLANSTILSFLTQFGASEYQGHGQPCNKIDMFSDRETRCGTWHRLYYRGFDEEYGEQAEVFLKQDEATIAQANELQANAPITDSNTVLLSSREEQKTEN